MTQLELESVPSARVPLALVFLGAMVIGFGLYAAPERTWLNLLVNGFYLLSLAISAMFFAATQLMTGARWSAGLRRIPEALMFLLPLAALVMLALCFGRGFLYPSPAGGALGHASSGGRAACLRPAWVFARLVLFLGLWASFVWFFRKGSLEQDGDRRASVLQHHRLTRYAAAFLLVFAPSFTMATYDWLLALEPQWFSTMFAVYAFAGMFVQGLAAVTLAVVVLRQEGQLGAAVETSQLHDLGKLLFAFSTFWAYIWVCQYLLVWYGNIPEEVTYYVSRTNGPWLVVFALNFVVNWLVPFVALMSARAKQSPRRLRAVAALLLVGHWLDLYVMVMPAKWHAPRLGPIEVMVPLAFASLAYLVVTRALSQAPLVPVNDPILAADRLRSARGHA